MASFPKLITPLTPGGLQSTALQQKPIDLSGILEAMQKDRLSKAAAAPKAKKGAADDYKIDGLEGAVWQAKQAKEQGQAEMADYIGRYGDLAFSLPQYKKSDELSKKFYTEEYQRFRDRDKDWFEKLNNELQTPNKHGVAAGNLYNLNKIAEGTLETQMASAENLRNRGVLENTGKDYEVFTHSLKDSQDYLDQILSPAEDAFKNTNASSKVVRAALAAGDVPGIMSMSSHADDNIASLGRAYQQALTDIGITVDKNGKTIWQPNSFTNPAQAGYLQEMLATTNAEFNPKYRDKDGKFQLEEFTKDTAPLVAQKVLAEMEKRISTKKTYNEDYKESSPDYWNAYGKNQELLSAFGAPPTQIPVSTAGDANVMSEAQALNLAGGKEVSVLSAGIAGQWLERMGVTTGIQKAMLAEMETSGIVTKQIGANGQPVYYKNSNAEQNLASLQQRMLDDPNSVNHQQKEMLSRGYQLLKDVEATKIVGENQMNILPVYLRNASELKADLAPSIEGKDLGAALGGTASWVGNTWGIFDLKGWTGKTLSPNMATMQRYQASNFVSNIPEVIDQNGNVIRGYTGYANKDANGQYRVAPIELSSQDNGVLKLLEKGTAEYNYAVSFANSNKNNPDAITHGTSNIVMQVRTDVRPFAEAKASLKGQFIMDAVQVPDIKEKSLYSAQRTELNEHLRKHSPAFHLGTSSYNGSVAAQDTRRDMLQKKGLTKEQANIVIRANGDLDLAAKFMYYNQNGGAKAGIKNKILAVKTEVYNEELYPETGGFHPKLQPVIETKKIGTGKNQKDERFVSIEVGANVTGRVAKIAASTQDQSTRTTMIGASNLAAYQDMQVQTQQKNNDIFQAKPMFQNGRTK